LLLLALPQAQDKGQEPKLPKEPIRDWKYQLKDVRKVPVPNSNPPQFTSVEEVTLILAGDEAVPVNVEKKIFDLRGVKASYFTKMYECPACKKPVKAAGRCPQHGLPLKEKTITSVEADRDFDMAGPEGILSGEGLFTDDAIKKEYHIAKNGFVEFSGDPSTLV